MSTETAALPGTRPHRVSPWIAAAGIVLALGATYLLGSGSVLAALGLTVVGLFAIWLAADYTSAAVALLAAGVLVPNGVALSFGAAIPLLTFQRVMLLLLVGVALVHAPARWFRGLWHTPGIRILWAMVLVLAISTALSAQPALSQREFLSERQLGLPLFFATVWLALTGKVAARRLLVALGTVGIVISILAVVEAATGHGVVASIGVLPAEKLTELGYRDVLETRAGLPRVESVFQHPLLLGAFLVAYVPLVWILRRHARTPWIKGYWTVAVVLGLTALILTWSRGAWVALLTAILLLRGSGWRRWLVIGLGGAAFFVVWSGLGFLQAGNIVYRWWLVSSVLAAMWGHYGFGTGPATFATSLVVRIAGTRLGTTADAMAYTLTMAIEAGPFYVALFWWLLLRVVSGARRAAGDARAAGRAEQSDLLEALRAGLLANLLLCLVSYSLFNTTGGLMTAFILVAATTKLSQAETPA